MKFTVEDIHPLALGVSFLGAGGGGDPYMCRLLAESAIKEFGAPRVMEVDELADDDWVFTVLMIGSPTVMKEKGVCGADIDVAIRLMEENIGVKATALAPLLIGGLNGCLPVAGAARLGLPLVNADAMGRTFPQLHMTTYNIYGLSASPMIAVDEHLNSMVLGGKSAMASEKLLRAVAQESGLDMLVSCYPMQGRQIREFAIHGSLTVALGIGKAIADGRRYQDPAHAVIEYLRSTKSYNQVVELFDGKVVDVLRQSLDGFCSGCCTLNDLNKPQRQMKLEFQNEFLRAKIDGQTVAMVPDLLVVVDRETGYPVMLDSLRYGQRVKVIGSSVDPVLRTPEALEVIGPHAFGLNEDYTPIEGLNRIG